MIGSLVDWLVGWLVEWPTDRPTGWLTGCMGVWLIGLFAVWTIGSSLVCALFVWWLFLCLFWLIALLLIFHSVICYKCPTKETLQDLLDQSKLCLTVEEVCLIANDIIRAMAYENDGTGKGKRGKEWERKRRQLISKVNFILQHFSRRL